MLKLFFVEEHNYLYCKHFLFRVTELHVLFKNMSAVMFQEKDPVHFCLADPNSLHVN